jgi:hypothetical protein
MTGCDFYVCWSCGVRFHGEHVKENRLRHDSIHNELIRDLVFDLLREIHLDHERCR